MSWNFVAIKFLQIVIEVFNKLYFEVTKKHTEKPSFQLQTNIPCSFKGTRYDKLHCLDEESPLIHFSGVC